ncbi:MAG: putative ABC transport system ATP-binding protein [Candidatus Berkelbacteria bacterium Athens1014_28]|uniref:Putative ABC transport system ATP-binding protein n=1 Tax=Candidatus Berkelbacteria bacterium Athens1014_28 TaxID=2017145 RepID=A0A554LKQ6_9BACT|nr:MAG: putative ABC transport system ATP-binding protein [Candidatus Berkelbacteria bacterium Athens1014_28]
MASSAVIEAKAIKKTFILGPNTVEVIKGVTFVIHPGDYVIFYGPSGCGKSTLLNLCSGLEAPSEGKFLIRGEEISKYKSDQKAKFRQSKIGIVFQSFNLLKSMTVQENVALPLLAAGVPRATALHRAANLLTVFGLIKHAKNIHTELSGGQQQRVAMARALSANPWIIICDEPTGNLDSKSAQEVMEIFYHLNRKSKRTILMVTHNPDHLVYASKIFEMKDGLIVKTKTNSHRPTLKKVGDFDLSSRSLEQT